MPPSIRTWIWAQYGFLPKNQKYTLKQVNTEARERRRSELKEAKLPPIKPRSEVIQPLEEKVREETNGTHEGEEAKEDNEKNVEQPEETAKVKEQNKGGKLGKFFSNFSRKQQTTQVIEENGGKTESPQETTSEDGSKDPSPEKTKKKVSFFRQFSQKKGENKENRSSADITSGNVDKTDEKPLEQEVKEDQDKSTNDKEDDQDTLDDEEDSDTEESETEDEERESQPPTLSGTELEQKTTVNNSNSQQQRTVFS